MARTPAILCLLIAACGFVCLAATPVAEDGFVRTAREQQAVVVLRATDEELDPADPDAHPLVFTLLDGPSHGILVGDLAGVSTMAPHTAWVALTYVPADGFVGTDRFVFQVTDSLGLLDTGQVLIAVVDRPDGKLNGLWTSRLTYDVQTQAMTAFTARMTTVYQIHGLTLRANALWNFARNAVGEPFFKSLTFDAALPLGMAGSLVSAFALVPDFPPEFLYWRTTATLKLLGLSIIDTFDLKPVQTESTHTISVSGSVGALTLSSTTTFKGCTFCFDRQSIAVVWPICCNLRPHVSLSFSCEGGFEGLSFALSDIPIPSLVNEGVGLYFGVTTTFDTGATGKTIAPSLSLRTKWVECVRLLTELDLNNMTLDGVSVYGLVVNCSFPGDVSLRMDTSFEDTKNGAVTGIGDYFERWLLTGPTSTCCGGTGIWQIATYFHHASLHLFEWGMTSFLLDMSVSDLVSIYALTTIRSGFFQDSTLEISIGFTARW